MSDEQALEILARLAEDAGDYMESERLRWPDNSFASLYNPAKEV